MFLQVIQPACSRFVLSLQEDSLLMAQNGTSRAEFVKHSFTNMEVLTIEHWE
jgi:hypothetical protein